MNYHDRIRVLAERVRDFVALANENKNTRYSDFLRNVRLELGVGDAAVRRVLLQDYKISVEDDRLVKA